MIHNLNTAKIQRKEKEKQGMGVFTKKKDFAKIFFPEVLFVFWCDCAIIRVFTYYSVHCFLSAIYDSGDYCATGYTPVTAALFPSV